MVDSGQLTGDTDFPDVDINKYGWQQFVSLDLDELEERSWRSDVIVSTNTPINAQVINAACKLKLIIAAGDSTAHIDHDAAKARDIQIMNVADINGDTPQNTQLICNQVVEHINAWIKSLPSPG